MARPSFDEAEQQALRTCLQHLRNGFLNRVHQPIWSRMTVEPEPVRGFIDLLQKVEQRLPSQPTPDVELPFLKAALLSYLRSASERHEERARKTPDPATQAQLEAELKPYRRLAAQPWFASTPAAMAPRLSDYLVMAEIDNVFGQDVSQAGRQYDEKFGILYAPSLFLVDLARYRLQCCELRGGPITVAYLDIDDFKSFNEEYSEPRVDSEILPRFMRAIEAVVYAHGYAYRFGGDEYIVLLPNRDWSDAAAIVNRLTTRLAALDYGTVARKPTISVGLCEVQHDSPLTDREVEGRAAAAKKFAKKSGKKCIALYRDGTGPVLV